MKTTERLLAAAKDIWAAYNEHPFVLGIQDGTLAREKFKYYIIQDYLYLEEYAKVFALGIAKAKSPETIQLFSKYVTLLTEGEMDIHRGYMGKFAVSREELEATPRRWTISPTLPICSEWPMRRGRRRFWRLSSPVPTAMRSSPGR